MAKARSCPNCKNHLHKSNYKFDSDLNVICGHCSAFVFKSQETKTIQLPETVYKFNPNKPNKI